MAKVDFSEGAAPFLNPAAYTALKAETKKTKDKASIRDLKRPRFSSVLKEAAQTEQAEALPDYPASEEALRELLDDVHSFGDELKRRPFPEEIKQYKRAVRNFLHYVVENGYTIEERTSGVNLKKRKKFTLVQVVDRKLESLAASILANQVSQIELLARIDEIAGLLVDLLQ
ncbi:MAG: DUF327 family protein [Treponema sp.]|jgi:uncharacterized protein YaaR (DUF327 family)|nr:DUF327 family protein [Treponema sp.]